MKEKGVYTQMEESCQHDLID